MIINFKKIALLLVLSILSSSTAFSARLPAKPESKAEKDKRMSNEAAACRDIEMRQRSVIEDAGRDPKSYKSKRFCQEAYDYMKNEYDKASETRSK